MEEVAFRPTHTLGKRLCLCVEGCGEAATNEEMWEHTGVEYSMRDRPTLFER
jgi:hypothetical protein